jgi:hypothetical protein
MRKLLAASFRSVGNAEAPAMTLNKMYHCVPRIMSGLTQTSTFSLKWTIATTATGNNRLAGKAARNWASGWIFSAQRGRRPIITPSGTQTRLAKAIRVPTRSVVTALSRSTLPRSPPDNVVLRYATTFHPQ